MTFFEFKENLALKIVSTFPTRVHPMHLTVLRLVMTIPLLFSVIYAAHLTTILLFLIMAALDYLDGPLARLRGQTTINGKLLDPFADKVMVLPIFYFLGIKILPLWLVWSTIGLEILLVCLVFLLKPFFEKIGQRRSLGANKFGKYKMAFQTLGVLWLLIMPANTFNNTIVLYIFYLALILSVASITKHLLPEGRGN